MRRDKEKKYRIALILLAAVIVFQAGFMLYLGLSRRPKAKPKPLPAAAVKFKGRIAIVIDDWGYNLNNLHYLENIHSPLTASVLPNLAYSRSAASALHNKGFEVILHLPMEPREKMRLERNTILTSMSAQEIKSILSRGLGDIYYARGVSNHMGSRATEDKRVMQAVMEELKARNLFFLDSVVSPKTVCESTARAMQVKFARRDIFLDNLEDRDYIRKQIEKLKARASAQGKAVGIGHDRPLTLEALAKAIPEMKKQGYRLVFVSQLAE